MNRDDSRSPSRPAATSAGVANPRRTRLSAGHGVPTPPARAPENRDGS